MSKRIITLGEAFLTVEDLGDGFNRIVIYDAEDGGAVADFKAATSIDPVDAAYIAADIAAKEAAA